MNIGAEALIPSRRSWNTWPISCRSSRTTNPIANDQPQISAYAAIETSIVAEVVSSFTFGSSSRTDFSFVASRQRPAAIGPI